jgi:hypothetical protein
VAEGEPRCREKCCSAGGRGSAEGATPIDFFKDGHAALGNPNSVWHTVSTDLARINPSFRTVILGVLGLGVVDSERSDVES